MSDGAAEIAAQIRDALESAQRKTKVRAGDAAEKPPSGRRKRGGSSGLFRLRDGWVERAVETRGDDGEVRATWRRVCTTLSVDALTRTENGEDWGRLLRIVDRDGTVHLWAAPAALFAGSGESLRAALLGLGLDIAPDRSAKHWLSEYILSAEPEARARCVGRVGWHNGRFVLPDGAIGGGADGEAVLLQTAERFEHAFNVGGTLEGWRAGVAAPAVGNSRLILALAAGFAGPLLALSDDEGGGLHLRGGSSTGKSTALAVAGSVWGGGGVRGYVRAWRSTDNGLESLAAGHCDALLCLDELAQVDPRAAGAAAYLLAQGRAKARAGRDGAARPAAEWRVLFLSSGEIGLADKIAESGARITAGAETRLIDLRADAGAGLGVFEYLHDARDAGAFAQALKAAAREHYGHAARVFLEAVTADLDAVRGFVAEARAAFLAAHLPAGASGQVRRVADRFGLIAAAGELASAVNVTGWPVGTARNAAARGLADWVADRGGIGSGELAEALRRLRAFLEANGRSRFEAWKGETGRAFIVNRAGFVKRDTLSDGTVLGPPEFYLLPSAFTGEVLTGLDAKGLARQMAAAGALVPSNDGQPSASFRVPAEGGRPTRLYRVATQWLEAEGEVERDG